jgi:hypothetical protein
MTSEVTVRLSVHGTEWDGSPVIQEALHQALEGLAGQVSRRMETTE